jgi:hypothetical protein
MSSENKILQFEEDIETIIDSRSKEIAEKLILIGGTKQFIFQNTKAVFEEFKRQIKHLTNTIKPEVDTPNTLVEVQYTERGQFEIDFKFGSDTLVYLMHTNIFTFPPEHEIFKSSYIKRDPLRAYCGMINVYDFLSDSIKYNRMNDVGYLIARIFINKDGHFFVQGKRQFSFMYNDLSQYEINSEVIKQIIQLSMLNAIEFDAYVPPFEAVKQVTLMQQIMEMGNAALTTGKRVGFEYAGDKGGYKPLKEFL